MDKTTAFESMTLFGVTNRPQMGYVNTSSTATRTTLTTPAWGTNETWAYKGQVFIPTTTTAVSFAKSIDDAVWVKLDGNVILDDGTWTNLTGTGSRTVDSGINGTGWHNIEIRFGNGAGGAGAQAQGTGWTTTYGFGVSGILGKTLDTATSGANGNNYTSLVDSGGTVLRFDNGMASSLTLQNTINVTANSTLDLGADIPAIVYGKLILNNSTLTVAATGASDEDIVQVAYGYGLFTGGLGLHYGVEKLGATVVPISGGNTDRQRWRCSSDGGLQRPYLWCCGQFDINAAARTADSH
jgi:hypothetical protein